MDNSYPKENPFATDDPAGALKYEIAWRRSRGDTDPFIVGSFTGLWINVKDEARRQIVMEAMKALSPHLQRTNGEPTPQIQQMFQAAIDSDDVHDALINGIMGLRREGLDKGGILFELDWFRDIRWGQLTEDQETFILDMMDGLVEWGNNRNLFDL